MADDAPINWKKGLAHYGGDEDMFRLMIERFEELSFNSSMDNLYKNVLILDYPNILLDARSIKGVSG